MKSITKILVFRLSSIGDIVLTSALIRCLKKQYPDAQIDFVIKKQFKQLVEFNPHLHTIYTINSSEGIRGLKKVKAAIKQEQYDVFLDIHKNMRSLFIMVGSGAKKKLTYKKHILKRTLLTSLGLNKYKTITPVYQRFIEAAKPINVQNDSEGTELFIPSNIDVKVLQVLLSNGLIGDKPYVLFCPGASFKNKQWLPERFVELAKYLLDKEHVNVVLSGGRAEEDICKYILQETNGRVVDLSVRFTILESAVIAKYAKAVVANDTGMLHISEALKVPVVGIYGPTSRQFGYYPILEKSEVVEVDLPCRPCTKMGAHSCPKKHWKCMKEITALMVYNKLKPLIQE